MGYYKWKPSKSKKQEFKQKMNEIDLFCEKNGIIQSSTSDSYYFTINGIQYRVSNHAVEKSVYKDKFGNTWYYHEENYREKVLCIHASKTRIIEIYTNLKNGFKLDSKGNIIK